MLRARHGATAHEAVGGIGDPVQAYCDLLEVRWLGSEQASRNVGDEEALAALALRYVPYDAAASMAVAEPATDELVRLRPDVLSRLDREREANARDDDE